jgi:hypothetical protein
VSCLASAVWAQAPAAESGPAAAAKKISKATPAATVAKTQLGEKPSGGPQEGIKVHGHWLIEVRNADGTLASHTEFDNALQFAGKNLVASFLRHEQSKPGRWTVVLDNLSGTNKACAGGTFAAVPDPGFAGLCYLTETDSQPSAFMGTNVSRNLTVTLVPDANNVFALVLSGSIKSLQQGAIDRVYTTLGACDVLSVAGFCQVAQPLAASSTGFSFAFVSIPVQGGQGPIPIQAGQTIDVTVRFTFS